MKTFFETLGSRSMTESGHSRSKTLPQRIGLKMQRGNVAAIRDPRGSFRLRSMKCVIEILCYVLLSNQNQFGVDSCITEF